MLLRSVISIVLLSLSFENFPMGMAGRKWEFLEEGEREDNFGESILFLGEEGIEIFFRVDKGEDGDIFLDCLLDCVLGL